MVEDLQDKIKKSKAIIFVNYEGLKVSDVQDLKRKLKKEEIDYTVAKKTLLKIALEKAKVSIDPKKIAGNFAVVFGYGDEVSPAKILAKFAKDNDKLKIVAAILDGNLVTSDKVIALSKLPSKQELLAKLLGSLNAPISGFVTVMAGNLRGLINVLNNIKKIK